MLPLSLCDSKCNKNHSELRSFLLIWRPIVCIAWLSWDQMAQWGSPSPCLGHPRAETGTQHEARDEWKHETRSDWSNIFNHLPCLIGWAILVNYFINSSTQSIKSNNQLIDPPSPIPTSRPNIWYMEFTGCLHITYTWPEWRTGLAPLLNSPTLQKLLPGMWSPHLLSK